MHRARQILGWLIGLASIVVVAQWFPSVWPLVDVDLGQPKQMHEARARQILLEDFGQDVREFAGTVRLSVRRNELDVLQEERGLEGARLLTDEANGLVLYLVNFRKSGEGLQYELGLHPDGNLVWYNKKVVPESITGTVSLVEAEALVAKAMPLHFGVDVGELQAREQTSKQRKQTSTHRFTYVRPFAGSESVEDLFIAIVQGEELIQLLRAPRLSELARSELANAAGPEEGLSTLGYILLILGLVATYVVFIFQVKQGNLRLGPPLWVGVAVAAMVLAAQLLDPTGFLRQNPKWPGITVWLKVLMEALPTALGLGVLAWTLLAAGTAVPVVGREKTESFWDFVCFRWRRPAVAQASLRGGLLGFFCGAMAIFLVKALELGCEGAVGLQPRGFYLSMLDRHWPALGLLLFFLPIAIVEEAGYRLFGGLWLRRMTGSVLVAILLPALIFGAVHTSLSFLPPEDPWWGRALLMFGVGVIWSLALFRFDFLTVVLSHLMADLVIFGWPLLTSAYRPSVYLMLVVISVPLWPALLDGIARCRDLLRSPRPPASL